MAQSDTWQISKMSGHVGARLTGVSVSGATSAQLNTVRDALFQHGVVVLPDQHLAPEEHIHLAQHFGEIVVNRFFPPVPGHPQVAEVRAKPDHTEVLGGTWHTDHSYDPNPAMCSILSAHELPTVGGDTHFASMTAAYHALSEGLKQTLRGLRAEHSDLSFAGSEQAPGWKDKPDAFRQAVVHPAIIAHPQTGAPCVYVNGDFTTRFEGWSIEESAPLLEYLYRFVTQPIFTARVIWEPGMVAIWDNRLVQHYATADYPGQSRLMHRITVEGQALEGF